MRRLIGVTLVFVGLMPVACLLFIWSKHMYTVGLSADNRGIIVLALLGLTDLSCLCGGLYLLLRPRLSN